MPKIVAHPLSARLVLLAAAAALALSVVWAMAVAEARDVDARAATSSRVVELAATATQPAKPAARAVRVSLRR